MQRPVWACTIKVSDPAPRHSLPSRPSSLAASLSLLFPENLAFAHLMQCTYYSDLFCLPIKLKVKRKKLQRNAYKISTFTKILRQLFNEHEESEGGINFVMDIQYEFFDTKMCVLINGVVIFCSHISGNMGRMGKRYSKC